MPSKSYSLLNCLRVMVGAWRDDPRDDATLLARFAEGGDESAFRALVGRHGPLVWQTCRRMLGDTPDAEDAFQTAFLALARKADQLRREPLGGWLHRVAQRAAFDARAGARRRRGLEQQLWAARQSAEEEDDRRAELFAVLDEELAGLPERLRVPLVLRYLEGKTLAEVAQILGCSLTAVTKRLARGEAILRQRLERRGLAGGVRSVAVLLGGAAVASAVPTRLIGSTAQAAVAFRSGALTGGAAEAARAVLGALPSPLAGMIMRKSLWIVLACVCSLGAGLAAWQASSARSEAVESPESAAAPKAAAEPGSGRVDRDGDPLPDGALARLGTLRMRHVGSAFNHEGAESVVISRDGKVLITAGPANPIRVWDGATGKLLRSFGGRDPEVLSIVLSPDDRTLAAIYHNGGRVSLWEVATGGLLRRFGAGIHALAFSRDGRTLLTVGEKDFGPNRREDNHIRVWEVATGKEVRDQPLMNAVKPDGRCPIYIFSPGGKTMASIHNDNNIVYLWEVASGKELCHLTLGKGTIRQGAVAFSPDSRFLAASSIKVPNIVVNDDTRSYGAVHLWEVATGKEVRKWTPDKTGTRSVAFSPDGKILATGSGFGPIRLWEAATGKELRQCQGYRAHVVALTFSPDGSTLASLAGKNDHTARLWEVASGKELVRPSRGHVGPVVSVSFSPDGKNLISGGRDGLVGLWNPETGQERRPLLRVGDFQALAALSADGKTILSVGNSFSPNLQGKTLREVAFQAPTLVCVWDRATGQKLREFKGPVGTPQSLTLSPDGKILLLSFWKSTYLIEVATGKTIHQFTDTSEGLKCAALSPDGKTLAVALHDAEDRSIVHFYATATGKALGSIQAHGKREWSLAFSPDGQTLAAGEEENANELHHPIRLWRVRADKKEWKEVGTLVGHQHIIWGLTFSPDGKTLASASKDGTLRLWEVATGKERRSFAGHRGEVWCLAFAPDGRHLVAGGNDTTILVWDVTGQLQSGQLPPVKLSAQEVKSLWADLAGVDAARAGRAVWALVAAPAQAIPLLQEHLRPVAPAGPRIVRLIADLDNDIFAVRQKAADELEKLGEVAEPALRQALAKSASVEMRRRLEQLLEPLEEKFPLSGEKLRFHRALEVLGQIGTPEALPLLEALARGAPEARQTLEAQAVLKCLRTRVNGTKP